MRPCTASEVAAAEDGRCGTNVGGISRAIVQLSARSTAPFPAFFIRTGAADRARCTERPVFSAAVGHSDRKTEQKRDGSSWNAIGGSHWRQWEQCGGSFGAPSRPLMNVPLAAWRPRLRISRETVEPSGHPHPPGIPLLRPGPLGSVHRGHSPGRMTHQGTQHHTPSLSSKLTSQFDTSLTFKPRGGKSGISKTNC